MNSLIELDLEISGLNSVSTNGVNYISKGISNLVKLKKLSCVIGGEN